MATLDVSRLVQGLVDFQNPQAKEDRNIAKGVLATPMREAAQDAMNQFHDFARQLAESVASGHLTQEQADSMRNVQLELVMAQTKYVKDFLEVKR